MPNILSTAGVEMPMSVLSIAGVEMPMSVLMFYETKKLGSNESRKQFEMAICVRFILIFASL